MLASCTITVLSDECYEALPVVFALCLFSDNDTLVVPRSHLLLWTRASKLEVQTQTQIKLPTAQCTKMNKYLRFCKNAPHLDFNSGYYHSAELPPCLPKHHFLLIICVKLALDCNKTHEVWSCGKDQIVAILEHPRVQLIYL